MARAWQRHFSQRHPGLSYREVNRYTTQRLWIHPNRRSQRGYQKPEGVMW
jgi:hypothetical protein